MKLGDLSASPWAPSIFFSMPFDSISLLQYDDCEAREENQDMDAGRREDGGVFNRGIGNAGEERCVFGKGPH